MKHDVIESLCLGIAALVDRERALQIEIDKVRAQKAERIARVIGLSTEIPSEPAIDPATTNKRAMVRAFIADSAPGLVFGTGELGERLQIDSNVVSAYLNQFRDAGVVEQIARGKFRVPEKKNAPPDLGEASDLC